MDITLDKIDAIRERTGVSYKEAKAALEETGGCVIDALIKIEESNNNRWTEAVSVKGSEAVEKIKSLLRAGNINRIRIKKDDYTILDIPVTAGAIGAVIIPQITAIGTAVALLSKCTIEVERPNKEIINVNQAITNTVENITDRMKDTAQAMKNAGTKAADNITHAANTATQTVSNMINEINITNTATPGLIAINDTTDGSFEAHANSDPSLMHKEHTPGYNALVNSREDDTLLY